MLSRTAVRPTFRSLLGLAAAGVLVLANTPAASAAPGDTFADLQDALDDCTSPYTVALTTNITEKTGTLTIGCDATIDLAGSDLTIQNVVISSGKTFTINDSGTGGILTADVSPTSNAAGIQNTSATLIVNGGTVDALGEKGGAGIGGSGGTSASGGDGGTLIVTGGTVNAIGGYDGSGIGGGGGGFGAGGNGGTLTINAGTVNATGGNGGGSGIGGGPGGNGGNGGDNGTLTINAGTVNAAGGLGGGSGIGGGAGSGTGAGGSGGDVSIGGGAVVTVAGDYTAVGAGEGNGGAFGHLSVDGTLRLPSGDLVVPDSDTSAAEITVGATGRVEGTIADPTIGASFSGDGQIDNHGAITLAKGHVLDGGVTVLDHHYDVTFDTNGLSPAPSPVTVFAASFDTGARTLPAGPADGINPFHEWNTAADGSGTEFTDTTTLPGSGTGAAVPVTLYAQWEPGPTLDTTLTGNTITSTAGTDASFTPTITDSHGDPYTTDPADWTVTDDNGTVTTSIDPATGKVTLTSTQAGDHLLTLTVPVPGGDLTATITYTTTPAALAALALTVSDTSPDEGDTITITATGTDAYGNTIGDVTNQTTFTSSVTTDDIDGNQITFNHASPHTITATHTRTKVTATITVDVTPAGGGLLPDTGTTITLTALAAALLTLGAGIWITRRRTTTT